MADRVCLWIANPICFWCEQPIAGPDAALLNYPTNRLVHADDCDNDCSIKQYQWFSAIFRGDPIPDE